MYTVKVIAGTLIVVGLVVSFFERLFPPEYYETERSRRFPAWLAWLGWAVTAVAAVAYFIVDIVEWRIS